MSVVIYQSAVWAGISTDPQSLSNLANCLYCSLHGLEWSVAIYLLATIAGVSTDPQSLVNRASCLECGVRGAVLWAAIMRSLCELAGGVTPPPTGNFMLYENGDTMLYENGDTMIYEQ